MVKRLKIEDSGGSVYDDLGFANPELEHAKAELAREIRSIIDIRGMTQTEAGKLLEIDQADVSRITRGRLGGYSLERLITMLSRLDVRVEIRVLRTGDSEHKMSIPVDSAPDSTESNTGEANLARLPEPAGAAR